MTHAWTDLDDDACITCAEGEGEPNECPGSPRPCGHHCNCIWVHDACRNCNAHINDDGEVVPPTKEEAA